MYFLLVLLGGAPRNELEIQTECDRWKANVEYRLRCFREE